ncbi:uncharacterized protein LOC142350983 [Convolutriloba macropyga]|uniref:uncharacterized protein LOC142350983 n=1 Tax=Convolutriloba macropyga TaxID=536237 RepID=UPI003F52140A
MQIFSVNDDCSREANELWKLNCVICIRNKVGADEDLEKRICDYKPTSDPSSTDEFGQYDYGSIDYWPNEGSDYMEIPYEDGSRNSVNKVVCYLKANKWTIGLFQILCSLFIRIVS